MPTLTNELLATAALIPNSNINVSDYDIDKRFRNNPLNMGEVPLVVNEFEVEEDRIGDTSIHTLLNGFVALGRNLQSATKVVSQVLSRMEDLANAPIKRGQAATVTASAFVQRFRIGLVWVELGGTHQWDETRKAASALLPTKDHR